MTLEFNLKNRPTSETVKFSLSRRGAETWEELVERYIKIVTEYEEWFVDFEKQLREYCDKCGSAREMKKLVLSYQKELPIGFAPCPDCAISSIIREILGDTDNGS